MDKWPSDRMHDLADRLDTAEDRVCESYQEIRSRVCGLKVWNWIDQAKKIDSLEHRNKVLIEELREVSRAYRYETGKRAPGTMLLLIDGSRHISEAFAEIRRRLGAFDGESARIVVEPPTPEAKR